MFGHNVFSYDTIPNIYKSESIVFNATDFDIAKKHSILGTVKAKWVEETQTYHYKAGNMSDWADTGKSSASEVKDSTVEVNDGVHANGDPIVHSVKSKIDAGQGLEFESLSPADDPSTDNSGSSNGGSNGGSNGTAVKGCMDETATNYDETATEDDGSCEYESDNTLIYLGLGAGALLIFMGLR